MRALTPRSLEWTDSAPVRPVVDRRMAVGADAVWEVVADHEHWGEWFTQIDAVIPGDPSSGVGGTRTVRIGRSEVEEEFLAWEPGRRFAFTVTHASVPGIRSMNEDIRLTPDGPDATTVTYTMAIDPVGGAVLRPLLTPLLRRNLEAALAALEARARG